MPSAAAACQHRVSDGSLSSGVEGITGRFDLVEVLTCIAFLIVKYTVIYLVMQAYTIAFMRREFREFLSLGVHSVDYFM